MLGQLIKTIFSLKKAKHVCLEQGIIFRKICIVGSGKFLFQLAQLINLSKEFRYVAFMQVFYVKEYCLRETNGLALFQIKQSQTSLRVIKQCFVGLQRLRRKCNKFYLACFLMSFFSFCFSGILLRVLCHIKGLLLMHFQLRTVQFLDHKNCS